MDDATAPARVLAEFMKTAPKLEFKAGVVEGTYYDANKIQAVATIPSREILISVITSYSIHYTKLYDYLLKVF